MGLFGGRKKDADGANIGNKTSFGKIKKMIENNEYSKIDVVTTDQGPMVDDVFWVFTDSDNEIYHIPQSDPKSEELIEICNKIDGFKMDALIDSMSCAGNKVFNLWVKK